MTSILRLYKTILGLAELFFGIPFLGGAIILAHAWVPLGVLIVLHFIGLVFSFFINKAKSGSLFGIIGNIIAFIPVIGMIMHILIGLVNVYQGLRNK
jgi:hypothetical protein